MKGSKGNRIIDSHPYLGKALVSNDTQYCLVRGCQSARVPTASLVSQQPAELLNTIAGMSERGKVNILWFSSMIEAGKTSCFHTGPQG